MRQVQTGIAAIQQVVNLRAGQVLGRGPFDPIRLTPIFSSADGRLVTDALIASLVEVQRGVVAPGQVGLFEPPVEDRGALAQIERDYLLLSEAMARVTAIDQANGEASVSLQLVQDDVARVADDLKTLADGLVKKVQDATDQQISESDLAVADSQRLFIAVAVVSIVVALLLGYLLSWSIVGPIGRMQTPWPRLHPVTSRATSRSPTAMSWGRSPRTSIG